MPIEPLEPDAGNAAEGRGNFSHAIFRAWLFCFNEQQIESGNQEIRKRI
jgi:hypothetical protein